MQSKILKKLNSINKTPCIILAFEDVGSGRSMEVYYKNLLASKIVFPIMAYTNKKSFIRAPTWIKNKVLYPIEMIDHELADCDRSICNKKWHRTNNDWFNDCIPYLLYLRKLFGEASLWVIDMPFPQIEKYMGRFKVQVFHGELFDIGVSYFEGERGSSFKNYSLIFAHGQLIKDKLTYKARLKENDGRIKLIGRVLDDSLHNSKYSREIILRKYKLDPVKKTVIYSPSWESRKIWAIGTKQEGEARLEEFCGLLDKLNLNLILRPHTVSLSLYNVLSIYKRMEAKHKNVYFDNPLQYSLDGPNESLIVSDVMITDLSSIASDFLSLNRPAIFIYPEKKDIQSGYWGNECPSFAEVSRFSYAVTSFQALYETLKNILLGESKKDLQKRTRVMNYIFANRGSSGKLFKNEIEKFIQNNKLHKRNFNYSYQNIVFYLRTLFLLFSEDKVSIKLDGLS